MTLPNIHTFEKKMMQLHAKIQRAKIPEENKRLLLGFERICAAEGLTIARRWKLVEYLHSFAVRYFPHPFQSATPDQIWDAVLKIESNGYAPWTKHDFKVAIRKFFKFVEWGEEALRRKDYPDSVSGISIKIKKRDQVRIQAADILTVDEVERLINAASSVKTRAVVSLMYELGARVGELGTMRVGSVSRDEYSFICDLNGKTGPRSVRAILSASALANWLNQHPMKNNPDAPLWVYKVKGEWRQLGYHAYQCMMKKLSKDAEIMKRVYPHLLRHSRITHLLSSGQMNESQAKKYFGLVMDSDMLNTYVHLTLDDANDAVLKMHGIANGKTKKTLTSTACGMCRAQNEKTGRFCSHCGYALTAEAADEATTRTEKAARTIAGFFGKPSNETEFRKWIRDAIEQELSRALPQQSSPPGEPTRARRAA